MFSRDVLRLDEPQAAIREQALGIRRRRGTVVGMPGGVDRSVVAALCARALGLDRVVGLFMPERDSSGDALRLGCLLAEQLGIGCALDGIGCYERRLEATRMMFRRPPTTDTFSFPQTRGTT
jgi:NAD+ synthase